MKLKTIKADEIRHKILVIITNIIIFFAVPVATLLLYLSKDTPTNFIWQDYVISCILYISPIIQCAIIKYHRNKKLRIEQRNRNSLLGRWNAVAKITREGVSDNLEQEIYDLKMKCASLKEQLEDQGSKIDNQEIKLNVLIKY